jgi:hypothetical protein
MTPTSFATLPRKWRREPRWRLVTACAGVGLEIDPRHPKPFEGMTHQQELGLSVDTGTLCGRAEPGEADLDGAQLVAAGPVPRVPIRGAAHRTAIGSPDLRERNEPLRYSRELGLQVIPHLVGAGHKREGITAAVLLRCPGQVIGVSDGQRLEPDQRTFECGYVGPRVHGGNSSSFLALAPCCSRLPDRRRARSLGSSG